jgi:TonB family protein
MKATLMTIFSVFLATIALAGGVSTSSLSVSRAELCAALEKIRDGERLQITTSGIFVSRSEMKVLYDPGMSLCQEDVQPSTWVVLPPSAANNSKLEALLREDGRVYVVFKGTLVGPRVVSDDTSISTYASYANRIAGRRYGHLNAFRTELIVDEVLEVKPVSKEIPNSVTWRKPSSEPFGVKELELPRYPEMACGSGISGEVRIKVKVESGKVVGTEMQSGDRILGEEAMANIRTWTFSGLPGPSVFTAVFIYALERRKSGESESPRVELQPPFQVKVIAPTLDW